MSERYELKTRELTFAEVRRDLASVLDEVVNDGVIVRVKRRGGDVAVIAAAELDSLTETLHLLRSPRNA